MLCPFTVGTTSGNATKLSNPANVKSGWSIANNAVSKTVEGIRLWHTSNKLEIRLISVGLTYASAYLITAPNNFDTTQWHHYAVTRKNGTIYVFIDGAIIFTVSDSHSLLFANQVAVGGYFEGAGSTVPNAQSRNTWYDDLFIAEYCKWDSEFDPTAITY